ncbi:1567_t:CDS:2 [Acaulospora morrowiae]|uniref:Protein YAE1 n=1 Tax=Acaulospora morrowiae TaxID=94023 RepID=A0A9N9F1V2_9GLOM|nr:1567_t:CDS:2 [Acaulospora morrowiae]
MVDKISDVWAISDDEDDNSNYEKVISSKEWERMNENFGNMGYREGIIEGKDVTIQKGFDRGYSEGVVIGKEVGRMRGILNTILEFYSPLVNHSDFGDEDIKDIPLLPDKSLLDRVISLENELACLTVDKVFTKEHFQSTITSKGDPCEVENTAIIGTESMCSCKENIDSDDCCRRQKGDNLKCHEERMSSQHPKSVKNSEQILKGYHDEVNKILNELRFAI